MTLSRRHLIRNAALQYGAAVLGSRANASPPHVPAAASVPVVNAGEHAWVIHDPRFPIDPNVATCPAPTFGLGAP